MPCFCEVKSEVFTSSSLKMLWLMLLFVFADSQLLPVTVRWLLWRHWSNPFQKRTMNHCDISSHSLFRCSMDSLTVFTYCNYVQFWGFCTLVFWSTAILNCCVGANFVPEFIFISQLSAGYGTFKKKTIYHHITFNIRCVRSHLNKSI